MDENTNEPQAEKSKKRPLGLLKDRTAGSIQRAVYFWEGQQLFAGAVLFTPTQQSLGGLQHSEPLEQQSLVLAFVALKQHSRGGSQHSEPLEQQSLVLAFVALKQQSLGGLQPSEPVEQQSNF
jgi:hypothetical protein